MARTAAAIAVAPRGSEPEAGLRGDGRIVNVTSWRRREGAVLAGTGGRLESTPECGSRGTANRAGGIGSERLQPRSVICNLENSREVALALIRCPTAEGCWQRFPFELGYAICVMEGMVYAVIGDLVRSRQSGPRAWVYASLQSALDATTELVQPVDRLETTVGDEFQGVYATLGEAALAALLVRLHLPAPMDARFGIGLGTREIINANRTPMFQDGPAWWRARAAINNAGLSQRYAERTLFDPGEESPAESADRINAFLLMRDAIVTRLDARARRMLLRVIAGASPREISVEEGISASAVAQLLTWDVSPIWATHKLWFGV